MSRPSMPQERKQKIKEMASQMNFTEVSKIFGVNRRTISRIVLGDVRSAKPRENRWMDLRKAEARITPEGCLNVHEVNNWLVG